MSAPSTMPLFTWAETRPQVSPSASEQSRQLARVEGANAEAIVRWCWRRAGAEFHLSALTADIMQETGCAPDSPRRVLAALRASGQVQVELLDRSRSYYRVIGVSP